MKKQSIPSVPSSGANRQQFDEAVKINLEIITGRRGAKLTALGTAATTPQIIAAINALIALLQE